MRNNVNYIGYSEKQILFRAKNEYHKEIENDNILYGKRAVSDIRNIDNPIVKLVENENLVNLAKYLLKVDEVVVLMGGFTQTYPVVLGKEIEFMQIHQVLTIIDVFLIFLIKKLIVVIYTYIQLTLIQITHL